MMNEVKLGTDSNIPWWLNLGLIEEENQKLIRVLEGSWLKNNDEGKQTHDCEGLRTREN